MIVFRLYGGSLEGVGRLSRWCGEAVWRVWGGCQVDIWRVRGG